MSVSGQLLGPNTRFIDNDRAEPLPHILRALPFTICAESPEVKNHDLFPPIRLRFPPHSEIDRHG